MGTATDVETAQYLTFRLDRELFAVDIAKVREVLELTTAPAVYRGLSASHPGH